jgi:hypothetical protein
MLKELLKKELRQLWAGTRTSGAVETRTEVEAWDGRMNGAFDPTAFGHRDGRSLGPYPRDVLATARVASGM